MPRTRTLKASRLRGILAFSKSELLYGVPLWLVVIVCAALYSVVSYLHHQKERRVGSVPDLRIVVSDALKPMWSIGANAAVPHISLRMSAQLTCQNEIDVMILKAYLEETKQTGPFFPVHVPKSRSTHADLFFNVLPIVAKEGQQLTRRVVLLDQFGNKQAECSRFASHPVGLGGRDCASSALGWRSLHAAVLRRRSTLQAESSVPQCCASPRCFAAAACSPLPWLHLNDPPSPH